jgi:pimeloyl-ACP methyl ester carboxylesterase
MPNITANDITIEFDTFGDQSNDPVLLIMGFGAQMTLWDENFCQMIADAGHYVIRFDNRDVGLSTKLDDAGTPSLADLFSGTFTPAYSLLDMANDAAGLLDALEIRSAHIVGASMGGMIAQTFAIAHPAKTRTLTSIMSTTGNPLVGQPSPDALAALTAPTATSRAEAIEQAVLATKVIGSPAYPAAEDEVREKAAASYDRSFYPDGRSRQLAAILTQPDRTEALAGSRQRTDNSPIRSHAVRQSISSTPTHSSTQRSRPWRASGDHCRD